MCPQSPYRLSAATSAAGSIHRHTRRRQALRFGLQAVETV